MFTILRNLALLLCAHSAMGASIFVDSTLDISHTQSEEEAEFIRVVTDPELLQQANSRLDAEGAREWFEAIIKKDDLAKKSSMGFTLRDPQSRGVIGFIMLDRLSSGYWETSTAIAKEFHGIGLGTNARMKVTQHVFRDLKLIGLVSRVSETNPASLRITEKLAFVFTGKTRKDFTLFDADWLDYRMSIETFFGVAENLPTAEEANIMPLETLLSEIHKGSGRDKAAHYYRVLMRDLATRLILSPEHISRLSEEMASLRKLKASLSLLERRRQYAAFDFCSQLF